jgi:nuclear cap-binding protein subunit 1
MPSQLRFFCLLAPLRIVTTASLFRLFESFTAVLNEPAVAIARADRAAECVLEPLCFAAHELIGVDAQADEKLDSLVDSIVRYGSTRRVSDDLLAPWSKEADLQNLALEVSKRCPCTLDKCLTSKPS